MHRTGCGLVCMAYNQIRAHFINNIDLPCFHRWNIPWQLSKCFSSVHYQILCKLLLQVFFYCSNVIHGGVFDCSQEFNKKSNSLYTILRSSRLAGSQRAPFLRQFLLRVNFNSFFEVNLFQWLLQMLALISELLVSNPMFFFI